MNQNFFFYHTSYEVYQSVGFLRVGDGDRIFLQNSKSRKRFSLGF